VTSEYRKLENLIPDPVLKLILKEEKNPHAIPFLKFITAVSTYNQYN